MAQPKSFAVCSSSRLPLLLCVSVTFVAHLALGSSTQPIASTTTFRATSIAPKTTMDSASTNILANTGDDDNGSGNNKSSMIPQIIIGGTGVLLVAGCVGFGCVLWSGEKQYEDVAISEGNNVLPELNLGGFNGALPHYIKEDIKSANGGHSHSSDLHLHGEENSNSSGDEPILSMASNHTTASECSSCKITALGVLDTMLANDFSEQHSDEGISEYIVDDFDEDVSGDGVSEELLSPIGMSPVVIAVSEGSADEKASYNTPFLECPQSVLDKIESAVC